MFRDKEPVRNPVRNRLLTLFGATALPVLVACGSTADNKNHSTQTPVISHCLQLPVHQTDSLNFGSDAIINNLPHEVDVRKLEITENNTIRYSNFVIPGTTFPEGGEVPLPDQTASIVRGSQATRNDVYVRFDPVHQMLCH